MRKYLLIMRPRVPGSVKEEYESLYQSLKDAVNVPGNVGTAAKDAFRLVQQHYNKDCEFALPPLKYLPTIAGENLTGEIEKIHNMSTRLKRQLPHMRKEVVNITAALEKLAEVSLREEKREYHHLARGFIMFLEREDQVLYPAAVLIGDLIQAKAELEGRKLAQLHA
jgi:hypothetical protein